MSKKLHRELITANVPALAVDDGRIALEGSYKTPTGQWVIMENGTAAWFGSGDPTSAPDQTMLDLVAAIKTAHVPDQVTTPPSIQLVLTALCKAHLNQALSAEESAAITAQSIL